MSATFEIWNSTTDSLEASGSAIGSNVAKKGLSASLDTRSTTLLSHVNKQPSLVDGLGLGSWKTKM